MSVWNDVEWCGVERCGVVWLLVEWPLSFLFRFRAAPRAPEAVQSASAQSCMQRARVRAAAQAAAKGLRFPLKAYGSAALGLGRAPASAERRCCCNGAPRRAAAVPGEHSLAAGSLTLTTGRFASRPACMPRALSCGLMPLAGTRLRSAQPLRAQPLTRLRTT